MFNNLIESSSHTRELKRRGSFVFYTVAAYALLFAIAGVVSVYAYDAHLDEQTQELTLLNFVPPPPNPDNVPPPQHPTGPSTGGNRNTLPMRTVLIEHADDPHQVPETISTAPPLVQPGPRNAVLGPTYTNPDNSGPITSTPGTGAPPVTVVLTDAPPPVKPAPTPVPPKIIRTSTILNSKALLLPKPLYPSMAKQIHIAGTVSVQVLIDESGNVVSAHAVSGPPLLIAESVKAAYQAKFSPTIIGDTPVKVSGVITYNFVLQ